MNVLTGFTHKLQPLWVFSAFWNGEFTRLAHVAFQDRHAADSPTTCAPDFKDNTSLLHQQALEPPLPFSPPVQMFLMQVALPQVMVPGRCDGMLSFRVHPVCSCTKGQLVQHAQVYQVACNCTISVLNGFNFACDDTTLPSQVQRLHHCCIFSENSCASCL